MVKIQTYILKKGAVIRSIEDLENNPIEFFVLLDELSDQELKEQIGSEPEYIPGCITVRIKGKDIFGFRHWDDIDWLYGLFIDALHQLVSGGVSQVSFSFPDQPLEVFVSMENGRIEIDFEGNKVKEPKFLPDFLFRAEEFYNRIHAAYDGEFPHLHILGQIKEIQRLIQSQ